MKGYKDENDITVAQTPTTAEGVNGNTNELLKILGEDTHSREEISLRR